jgi:hypothetical protein
VRVEKKIHCTKDLRTPFQFQILNPQNGKKKGQQNNKTISFYQEYEVKKRKE